jgi:hypothetical protein
MAREEAGLKTGWAETKSAGWVSGDGPAPVDSKSIGGRSFVTILTRLATR